MKTTSITNRSASVALALCLTPALQAAPEFRRGVDARHDGKAAAMREEEMLDRRDTHGLLGVWDHDKRPRELAAYQVMTFKRIRAMLVHGRLTEEQGSAFKTRHEEITADLDAKRADGLSDEERTAVRSALDQLNDEINRAAGESEQGAARTPLLNLKQHRMEERIQFGERSGRLSKGEAASLRRKLERVGAMEERLKQNDLTTRERERLHADMNDMLAELRRKLL